MNPRTALDNSAGKDQGADGDWTDLLLKQAAANSMPIAEGGFTGRVIGALPVVRRRSPHRWIIELMGVVGFVVGLGVLSGGEVLTFLLTGLARSGALSLEHLLLAAIPLGVLYWVALGAAWQET